MTRADRTQQRLGWHLFQLDPTYVFFRSGCSAAPRTWNASAAGWPGKSRRCRCGSRVSSSPPAAQLNRTIAELDQELEQRVTETAPGLLELPGCAAVTAAKLLAEVGPIDRFKSDAQLARHSGVAPVEASSGRTQRHRLDRRGNRQLNAPSTESRSPKPATTPTPAPTSTANAPKAKAAAKPSAGSNASSSASSTTHSKRTPP